MIFTQRATESVLYHPGALQQKNRNSSHKEERLTSEVLAPALGILGLAVREDDGRVNSNPLGVDYPFSEFLAEYRLPRTLPVSSGNDSSPGGWAGR